MIIDFRVRPPFKSFCNLNIYGPRESNPDPVTAPGVWLDLAPCRSFDDRSIERFVEEMDEAGIDVAVAMGRNSPRAVGVGCQLRRRRVGRYVPGAIRRVRFGRWFIRGQSAPG